LSSSILQKLKFPVKVAIDLPAPVVQRMPT